jgi:ribonuclease P protein component
MSSQRFSRVRRVRRRSEFQRVFDAANRAQGRYVTVLVAPNGSGEAMRLGIVASRKFGNAVQRNRAKRLIREVFRRAPIRSSLDVVVIPRREFLAAPFPLLESDLRRTLQRGAATVAPQGVR